MKNRGKELLQNTIIIAIGNLSTQIISFFLLPLYTSILSTKDYGIYDLLITVSTFILPIITLLMEEALFRFLIDCKDENEIKETISQSIIFIFFNTIIITILFLISSFFIKTEYNLIFLLYIISNIFVVIKNAITRGTGKIKVYTVSNFLSSLIIIILNLIMILKLNLGVISLLVSTTITNFLISIIILIKLKITKYISFKSINPKKIKQMLKYSLPLVPNSISWGIINLSDRIIISNVLGPAANGIYSIAYKFPNIINTIYGFFYTSWQEISAKVLNDDNPEKFYNTIFKHLKRFTWSILIVIIAILPLIFDFIIKKEFAKSYTYIPILILAIYYSNISGFLGGIFSAYKDTKIMGKSTIIAAIINLIINIALIKHTGLWAAAISTLISTLFIYLYRLYTIKKYITFEKQIKENIFMIIILLISCYSYYILTKPLQILFLIILSIITLIYNKEVIELFIKSFNKNKHKSKKITNTK